MMPKGSDAHETIGWVARKGSSAFHLGLPLSWCELKRKELQFNFRPAFGERGKLSQVRGCFSEKVELWFPSPAITSTKAIVFPHKHTHNSKQWDNFSKHVPFAFLVGISLQDAACESSASAHNNRFSCAALTWFDRILRLLIWQSSWECLRDGSQLLFLSRREDFKS